MFGIWGVRRGASIVSHLESSSRCCAFLQQRFRAVIVSVSTSDQKPHAPVFFPVFFSFLFVCVFAHVVFLFFSLSFPFEEKSFLESSQTLRGISRLDHGGHRGSRLDAAEPECPAGGHAEQGVRHLQERHAAHRWSGKTLKSHSGLWPHYPVFAVLRKRALRYYYVLFFVFFLF